MADARNEKVWTEHAREHKLNETPHIVSAGNPHRTMVEELEGVKKVLDLGCGSALWRHVFDGLDYHGADQNQAMIDVAKTRFPDDKFYVCNGMSLDFEDGSFDLVFTASVLQHNQHPDKEKVVTEIRRVLRPGGYYLCEENTFREDNFRSTFRGAPELTDDMSDGYSFTKSGWERFMSRFGFRLEWFRLTSCYLFIKE